VPLYRGRDFSVFDPVSNKSLNEKLFLQYGLVSELIKHGANFKNNTLVLRHISGVLDRRSLIVSMLPRGLWLFDTAIWLQHPDEAVLWHILCSFGSITSDFLIKLKGGAHRTQTELMTIPITAYGSAAMDEAIRLAKELYELKLKDAHVDADPWTTKIDALVWLHYGNGQKPLDREGLDWVLSTQFDCLNRQNPHYRPWVCEAYDDYAKRPQFRTGPTKDLFKENIITLNHVQDEKQPGSRNTIYALDKAMASKISPRGSM
jgi:hypothetical protein